MNSEDSDFDLFAGNNTTDGYFYLDDENFCDPYTPYLDVFTAYYSPFILVVGLLGNSLSCGVFLTKQLRTRSSSYYLASLALTDFCFLVMVLTVNFGNVFNLERWCQWLTYVSSVTATLSVWLTVAFTVERFIAVRYPLHKPHICTVTRAKVIVIILVLTAAGSQCYVFWTAGVTDDDECDMLPGYEGLMVVISFIDTLTTLILPVCLIIVMNTMIARSLHLFGRRIRLESDTTPGENVVALDSNSGRHCGSSKGCARMDSTGTDSVVNFNGKHGCLKCTTVGEYSYVSHTVYFARANCERRTNELFREKKYGSHHKQDSPLLQLPIDMIEDFPVADSLHLIDLGIMKKCLLGWRDGSFGNYKTKWCAKDIFTVSNFLLSCKLPREIHRSVRGLDVLCHWKGSEYRAFLYYLGIIILKDVLAPDVYQHFLKFFCAITICSTNSYKHFLNLAEKLLNHYVEYYRDFYGEDYISSNVHNLTHLVDEVRRLGPLPTFNAYPFESRLYQIKNLLRNGNLPLSQAAKRMSELMQNENDTIEGIRCPVRFPLLKKKMKTECSFIYN